MLEQFVEVACLHHLAILRAAVVGGFPAGGLRRSHGGDLRDLAVPNGDSKPEGVRTSVSPCPGLTPYARCHRACVEVTPRSEWYPAVALPQRAGPGFISPIPPDTNYREGTGCRARELNGRPSAQVYLLERASMYSW